MTACALGVSSLACFGIYFPKQFSAVMFVELILCTGCCDGDAEGLWDLHEKPAAYYQRNWSVRGSGIWGKGVLEANSSWCRGMAALVFPVTISSRAPIS